MKFRGGVVIYTALVLSVGLSTGAALSQQSPGSEGTKVESRGWIAADHQSEQALQLKRRDIAEIQAQLMVLGFDPKGIDGEMGPGTRQALADWQKSQSIPATGYLDEMQRSQLQMVSLVDYSIWVNIPENKALLERASRPRVTTHRKGWYRDSRGRYCHKILVGTWCQQNRPRSLR